MIPIVGDIWAIGLKNPQSYIVIPTNAGWNGRGHNVMGAGLAGQAKALYPDLPKLYGEHCQKPNAGVMMVPEYNLFMFPTKPLNKEQPQLSWKNKSCLGLIRRSAGELRQLMDNNSISHALIPMVGCGHGGLSPSQVIPMLSDVLGYCTLVAYNDNEASLIRKSVNLDD